MVPTYSNSREHESSRVRLMAHQSAFWQTAVPERVSQNIGRVDPVEVSPNAGFETASVQPGRSPHRHSAVVPTRRRCDLHQDVVMRFPVDDDDIRCPACFPESAALVAADGPLVELEDREIKALEAERAEGVVHHHRCDLGAESTSETLGIEEANGVAGAPVSPKRMEPCRAEELSFSVDDPLDRARLAQLLKPSLSCRRRHWARGGLSRSEHPGDVRMSAKQPAGLGVTIGCWPKDDAWSDQ
jgi:hypothetical protein